MTMLFLNNWQSVLTADADSTTTSLQIETDPYARLEIIQGGDYYPALLFNGSSYEYVYVVEKSGANTIKVERGKENSSQIACPRGSKISLINTAGVYQNVNQKESAIQINKNEITSDTTIPEGYNAESVGPLSIDANVKINGRWIIL